MTNIELRQVKNPQGYHKTDIEWADFSANPMRAVVKHDVWVRDGHVVSEADLEGGLPSDTDLRMVKKGTVGWAHCYANAINRRFGTGLRYTEKNLEHVELVLDEQRLQRMLTQSFKKPVGGWKNGAARPVCFIGDMTDLALCTPEQLDRLYAVMALRPDVVFMVLTKRPERMAEYFNGSRRNIAVYNAAAEMIDGDWSRMPGDMASTRSSGGAWWPLPNVWHGTSAEDQKTADERIPHLLRVPGKRFLSLEPLLGGIDLTQIETKTKWPGKSETSKLNALHGYTASRRDEPDSVTMSRSGQFINHGRPRFIDVHGQGGIHWIIGGGESGTGARACDVSRLWSLKEQCAAAGVPFFLKQLGSVVQMRFDEWNALTDGGSSGSDRFTLLFVGCDVGYWKPRDSKGGDMSEWPEGLRVREMPEEVARHFAPPEVGTGEDTLADKQPVAPEHSTSGGA